MNTSKSELIVMRAVWALGEASVDDVVCHIAQAHNWAVPTIKTLLGRLVKKGYLRTTKSGRKFIYSATLSECQAVQNLAGDFLAQVCATKQGQAISDLIDMAQLSHADIQQLIKQLQSVDANCEVACNCLSDQVVTDTKVADLSRVMS